MATAARSGIPTVRGCRGSGEKIFWRGRAFDTPWDVRYDPDRAKELLETGPREYDRLPDGRPYDGRPWWQA